MATKRNSHLNKSNNTSEKKTENFKVGSENARFLLTQKVSYLHTVATICMSWWVSSIVFCGSIIAAVWVNRDDLYKSGIISELGYAVGFFFFSFICFGFAALYYLYRYKTKIKRLVGNLKAEPSEKIPENIFNYEINSIMCGIIIGIITFILILGVWVYLFTNLNAGHWKVLKI